MNASTLVTLFHKAVPKPSSTGSVSQRNRSHCAFPMARNGCCLPAVRKGMKRDTC